MKKSIFMNTFLVVVLLSLIITFGCTDKKSTDPDGILDKDGVDVTLIDNWDLWEYQTGRLAAGKPALDKAPISSREVEGYPALVEELYANIEKHKLTIDGFILDSAAEDIESVHMNTCQIWTEDEDENPTYYYDYFYNENSGALWLRSENTADIIWSVDPTIIDTIYVGPDSIAYYVSGEDYTLLYRHNAGPMLILSQPANNLVFPIPGNPDLNDLTPKFKWTAYTGASEYTIQVRLDTLFSQSTGFVIDTLCTAVNFEPTEDLDNFALYYWRVKADNSNWSSIWNFATHQVVILTNPVNRNHEGMKPNFVWLPLQGASEYTLQVSDDVNFTTTAIDITTTNTSYSPTTNLQPNTKYFWKVKGNNSGNNWSIIWYITTDKRISLTPDAIPIDDKTEVVVPVVFDWPNLSNTTNYRIQVAIDSLFAATDIVLDEYSATSDYTDTGILQTNNEYFWRVNSDVAYGWSDTLSFKTNDVVLLNLPEDGAADIGVITQFKWERFNNTQTVYIIQVADENTFANPLVDSHIYYVGSTITCETASRIQENTTDDLIEFIPLLVEDFDPMTVYYWRVQRDALGWSEIWTFTTLDLAGETVLTEPLTAAEDVEPLAQFKWEAVPGIEFYRMQVSLDPDLADTLWVNKVATDRTYTLVNNATFNEMLLVGETYYWRARSDRTDWSDIWSFTVRTGIPYDVEAICMEETPNKVDLLWECQSGEYTLFWVERSVDNGATWTELGSVVDTKREFVDFDLALLTSYTYRVRTEYPLGYSIYSDEVSITTEDFDTSTAAPEFMTSVSGGTFSMGSAAGDDDELPLRNITLTHDFEIGTYEISNAEYCKVLNWALGKGKIKGPNGPYGDNFTYAADAFSVGNIFNTNGCCIDFSNSSKIYKVDTGMENYPVFGIKWFGVIAYANWLSMIEGVTPLYTGTTSVSCNVYGVEGYRLPTEAEWEFAAIGGNSSAGYTYSGSSTIGDVAWYYGNSGYQMHAVGDLLDNELNLYDMSGNAWEWCTDKYADYDPTDLVNPTGPTGNISNNTTVVVRGGSWEFDAYHLRNTNRSFSKANLAYKVNTNIGFRIVKITP